MTAKSLDPYIYRNVELNCLKDLREANNSDVYKGDYDFKVGAKCQVELEASRRLSVCHIQAINEDKSSCLVFVEGQGKFQDVPYRNLHPIRANKNNQQVNIPKGQRKKRLNLLQVYFQVTSLSSLFS